MLLTIGQILKGRYQITELLGEGGMGEVYKALDLNLQKEVAVKIIRPDSDQNTDTAKKLLIQEGRRQARLEHPNILPVTDADEDDSVVYLVMRYVPGGTLADRLKNGPLPLDETNKILAEIAGALDYVHTSQTPLVHRDLKPANILFDPYNRALVSDFGLAYLKAEAISTEIRGTPLYMAPEQAKGEPLDARTDIYALGVILFEVLIGHPPFLSPPGLHGASAQMAIMQLHLAEAPPLPRSLNPTIPALVEQVVLKALAKNPSERYQRAGEMAAAFAGTLAPTVSMSASSPKLPSPISRPEPPPLSPPRTNRVIWDLLKAMNELGEFCGANVKGLKEAEVVTAAAKLFDVLGYNILSGDLRLERTIKGKRADIVLQAAGGHPLAVVEFKRPSLSPDEGLDQLEKLYVATLLPDLGVLCNGIELWIGRREDDHLGVDIEKFILSKATEVDANRVWMLLARRQLNLSDLKSVEKAIKWLTDPDKRLPVTGPHTPGGRAFLSRFALSRITPFGVLVRELSSILRFMLRDSSFTQGAYSFWRQIYARQMESDEIPASWRSFLLSDMDVYYLMFALETAYAILARLLLARTMESNGFPGMMIERVFCNQLENELVSGKVPARAYVAATQAIFRHAGNQAFTAIFTSDIFDWWHDLDKTAGYEMVAHALAEATLATFQFDFGGLSGDLLGQLYQSYFDAETRKALGEFYTPPEVVDFILDEVGYTITAPAMVTRRLLDPSCGSGSFIIEALRRYLAATALNDPREMLLNLLRGLKIVGFDVNPFAVLMSQINYAAHIVPLYKRVLEEHYELKGITIPIFRTDSLRKEARELEQVGEYGQQMRLIEEGNLLLVRTELPVSAGSGKYATVEIPIPRFDLARSQGLVSNPEEYFVALQVLFSAVADGQTEKASLVGRLKGLDLPYPAKLADHILPAVEKLNTELTRLQKDYADGRFLKTMTDLALAVVLKNNFKYSLIVGNPPYVRIEQIPEILRRRWEGWYIWAAGKFDIYIPFLERGVSEWLEDEGKLGVICSNRFLLANYAGGMRIERNKPVAWGLRANLPQLVDVELLLDFRDSRVFKDALNYPVILILNRLKQDDPASVVTVRVFADPDTNDQETRLSLLLSEVVGLVKQVRAGADFVEGLYAEGIRVPVEALKPEAWLLMPLFEQAVFKKIEQAARVVNVTDNPLYKDKPPKDQPVHPYTIRLTDITSTRSGAFAGYQTSADDEMVLRLLEDRSATLLLRPKGREQANWQGPIEVEIEKAVMRPWLFGRDIERWRIAWDGWYVFFPYAIITALEKSSGAGTEIPVARYRLIPTSETEEKFRKEYKYIGQFPLFDRDFPLAWRYINHPTIERRLRKREKDRFKLGKPDAYMWYGSPYPRSLDLFERPKLLIQGLSPTNDTAVDEEGNYVFAVSGAGQAYGLLPDTENVSIALLTGLLNSKVFDFYLKHISTIYTGRTYSYGDQFIKQFPIKLPLTDSERDQVQTMADQARQLTQLTGNLHLKEKTWRDFPRTLLSKLPLYNLYSLRQQIKGQLQSAILSRGEEKFEMQHDGSVLMKFGKSELILPDETVRDIVKTWLDAQPRKSIPTSELMEIRFPDSKKGRQILLAAMEKLAGEIAQLRQGIKDAEYKLNEMVAIYYGLNGADMAVIEKFLKRF